MDGLGNALSGKGLFTESSLDVIENLSMGRIVLVEDVLELEISRTETVAEVLSKDPAAA